MEGPAAAPAPNPIRSLSPVPSSSPRGFKKVLPNRSRTSIQDSGLEVNNANGAGVRGKSSDSAREASPVRLTRNPSRDGSASSGSSGIRKLIPGHAKRKKRRKKIRGEPGLRKGGSEQSDSNPALNTDSYNTSTTLSTLAPDAALRNKSSTSLLADDTSLLTDDSEPTSSRPHLMSQESHAGYLTHTSPFISTTQVGGTLSTSEPEKQPATAPEGGSAPSPALSQASLPSLSHSPTLPVPRSSPNQSSLTLPDRANTLGLSSDGDQGRRRTLGHSVRGISSGRKLREALQPGKSNKSPRVSPERGLLRGNGNSAHTTEDSSASGINLLIRRKGPAPPPIQTDSKIDPPVRTKTSISVGATPHTPLSAASTAPSTTVTPPTPVESRASTRGSPTRSPELSAISNGSSATTSNSSTSAVAHRLGRSESGPLHQPSKLSNAISAPLTPMIEEAKTPSTKSEPRNVSQNSGFFATWVSAAQNAATTITSTLNTQNKGRASSDLAESEKVGEAGSDSESIVTAAADPAAAKKQLAVETLGAGDLKLSHLGIGADSRESLAKKPSVAESQKETAIQRDEAAAKIEDMLAKRAVSAAYEKPSDEISRTPVAELSDPMTSLRHGPSFNNNNSSELQTTPTGSVVEGETGSVKRNNSVRSRLTERRKRGTSNATGASSVGTVLATTVSNVANPTTGPKLTGFAIAPRSRNRTFHQLFRSVPEDDFLIEDYSCALQKEILLAGRLYISEGHVCFSSNILGWVTTLVISFEEVMAIEKETTAMVFPNAIAVQTLHARHIFRSLLSREATFDLMTGIWKQSHPTAFTKSVVGRSATGEITDQVDRLPESESDSDGGFDDADEIYDEDEGEEASGSGAEARSVVGSEISEGVRQATRKSSALNGGAAVTSAIAPNSPEAGGGQATEKAMVAASAATVDFPGPPTHGPTDCTDVATHYDKVLKDESIPAPLGRIYSMMFGPTSGVFLTKYLVDEQKVMELHYEDDKKGLGDQNQSRAYSYVKPLYGSIGPKQTRCNTTENLDVFDLERSISVTCTTQTPDVPNGNLFSVKTRYCLSWAPGNATRFQMNCTIEWTAKSWLKGPIEKGATDGQQTYGNDLVKALKAAVSTRSRVATGGSKPLKAGKRKKKADRRTAALPQSQLIIREQENWGLLEPLRGILGPIVDIFRPFSGILALGVILLLLSIIWWRGPPGSPIKGLGYHAYSDPARFLAYEELWQNEESDLWTWLDERIGMEGLRLHEATSPPPDKKMASRRTSHARVKERQRILGSRHAESRLRGERMAKREMEDAIRVTEERLDVLKKVIKNKSGPDSGGPGGERPTSK